MWNPYISGFFDAEGHCTKPETFKKTGKKKVQFHQNNRETLEFVKYVLAKFEIKSGKLHLTRNRKCYALYVQSKEGIIKFSSIFELKRKKQDLENLVSILSAWGTPKRVPSEMYLSTAWFW